MSRLRPLVAIIAALATTVVLGAGAVLGESPALAATGPGWRMEMLTGMNVVRAAAGVAPLKPCPSLRRAAQQYAMLMSSRDHFGHIGPDGAQPGERMMREGYRWRAYAENIAAGQRTVEDVLADWLASPGHHANLVDPAFRHVGLGHASSGSRSYGDYWVQDFGRGRGC
jgi:uncharacterized protein YkwD